MGGMPLGHILVATDFSPHADVAQARAVALAVDEKASLTILHVSATAATVPAMPEVESAAALELAAVAADLEKEVGSQLAERAERARAAGVEPNLELRHGHPDDIIVQVAEEVGADLLVIGTHGRTGITRFLLGSVAEHIVRRAGCDVLVARGEPINGVFHRALVATDFSPSSADALRAAMALSEGPIDVVHAWQYPVGTWGMHVLADRTAAMQTLREALIAGAEQKGSELMHEFGGVGRELRFLIEQGPSANVVTELADRGGHDLIALGTHGYRGFRRFLLGSVAEAVVRHAHCSVLVTHAEKKAG
jgi:nucleotide-binding universal stress UspA family protein